MSIAKIAPRPIPQTAPEQPEPIRYEVHAPDPVKWLMSMEPVILEVVQRYAEDRCGNEFDIVLPPDPLEVALARKADRKPDLPTVRLYMDKGRNSMTGKRAIKVSVDDKDMAIVDAWRQREFAKHN